MPSLDTVHTLLQQFVPGAKRENTAHITGALFCPNTQDDPKIHSNNGIYVVVHEEVVYTMCTDKACDGKRSPCAMAAQMVEGTSKWSNSWFKYTEESYAELESRANGKGSKGKDNKDNKDKDIEEGAR
jgi:hypothetical protein